MLAHAVMQIAAAAIGRREGAQAPLVLGCALEIRRAADQLGNCVAEQIDDIAGNAEAVLPRLLLCGASLEAGECVFPTLGQATRAQAVELAPLLRRQPGDARLPG